MSAFIDKCFKNILFILTFCLITNMACAQQFRKLKQSWKKPEPWVELPEVYKNEEAVAIFQKIYLSNNYDRSSTPSLTSNYSIAQRIRVLTKSVLEELSTFYIDQFPGSNPVTIDARTIKKNGETILADRESIKELKTYDKSTGSYKSQYRISIPGIEVGDDIEIIYAIEKPYLIYSDDIYLHGPYVILKSEFTFYTSRGIETNIYNHNNMPKPTITELEFQTVDKWHLTNLPGLGKQLYRVSDNEIPYVRIHVNRFFVTGMDRPYEIGLKSWGEVFEISTQNVFNKNQKDKGLNDFFAMHKSYLDTMNTFGKVSHIVNFLNKEMKFGDNLEDNLKNLPLATLIQKKEIDDRNLMLFYKYMFTYFKIPYYLVIAKNKYRGELSIGERSLNQVSDLLLAFNDQNNVLHYI